MIQKQYIELIQDEYSDVGETIIRILLNQGARKFIEKTRILSRHDCLKDFVVNQRLYDFRDFTNISNNDDILEVYQVDLDNVPLHRLIGEPSETDASHGSDLLQEDGGALLHEGY